MDLNADVGEASSTLGIDLDLSLLEDLTSANIACGFHAGTATTMRVLADRCAELGIRLGAHVSYHDKVGFGRRQMVVPHDELVGQIEYQIGTLSAIANSAGTEVSYVKPHGALYNSCFTDSDTASAVVEAILAFDSNQRRDLTIEEATVSALSLVIQPHSVVQEVADELGVRIVSEGFADRSYASDGSLLPRSEPGSVLTDPYKVAAQVRSLLLGDLPPGLPSRRPTIQIETICVHSDTPNVKELLQMVKAEILNMGVTVGPWQ